jgi:hypothetical protein
MSRPHSGCWEALATAAGGLLVTRQPTSVSPSEMVMVDHDRSPDRCDGRSMNSRDRHVDPLKRGGVVAVAPAAAIFVHGDVCPALAGIVASVAALCPSWEFQHAPFATPSAPEGRKTREQKSVVLSTSPFDGNGILPVLLRAPEVPHVFLATPRAVGGVSGLVRGFSGRGGEFQSMPKPPTSRRSWEQPPAGAGAQVGSLDISYDS